MTPGNLTPGNLQTLGALLRSPSGVDIGFLQHEFGAAAAQVHDDIERLRALGCRIEPLGLTGWRLRATDLSVWQDYLEHRLREAEPQSSAHTEAQPWRVMVYRQVRSTQEIARQLGRARVAILANEQTAGRGRLGRKWLAPPGACVLLTLTHALGSTGRDTHDHLQFVVAVAVAQALERLSGRRMLQLKWPNDVMVQGRKLSGILIETIVTSAGQRLALIGIGINVSLSESEAAPLPEAIRARAIDLRELGSPVDRLHVAAEIIVAVDRLLHDAHLQWIRDEWRARHVLQNHHAVFETDGQAISGTVLDLDMTDGLIVRRDDGTIVHLHAATTTVLAQDG